jgi:protocatechuate 3,4-dioxygenase beta subunit
VLAALVVATVCLPPSTALAAGGQITGTVTGPTGAPVAGVVVVASSAATQATYATTTWVDGTYVIPGLPAAASYTVEFEPSAGGLSFADVYYDGKSALDADAVAVTDGHPTSGIDAQLRVGGEVDGTVSDPTGAPVAGVEVRLSPDGSYTWTELSTDAAGRYTFTNVPAGRYTVAFLTPLNATISYVSQYYDGKDLASADVVVVTDGASASGIDATLQPLGTIVGTVTGAQGHALAGAEVSATGAGSTQYVNADADGRYMINGLPGGSYAVTFQAAGYVAAHYHQNSWAAPADPVSVTDGQVTPGIDAQLQLGGRISGRVTDTQGNSLAGAYVALEDDPAGHSAQVGADGTYTISEVEPGAYKVHFVAPPGLFDQYYSGAASAAAAAPVTVTGGATTSGIDAQLQTGGVITGTVTDTQGHPLAGITAAVPNSAFGLLAGPQRTTTDAAGHYRIDGLTTGTYHIAFAGGGYIEQYYGGTSYDTAAPIDVSVGTTRTGIDARLEVGGTITGTLTDARGAPLQGSVFVDHLDGSTAGLAGTDAAGRYTVGNLASGSYIVVFTAPGPQPLGLYYNGRTSLGTADLVTVTAGATTSGIDGRLTSPLPAPALGPLPIPPVASTSSLDRFHGTLAVSPTGAMAVPLRCAGPGECLGGASLSVTVKAATARRSRGTARRKTIATARFRLAAGAAAAVRLRLTAAGRSLLRAQRGRITATLTVATADRGGIATQTATAHLRSRR